MDFRHFKVIFLVKPLQLFSRSYIRCILVETGIHRRSEILKILSVLLRAVIFWFFQSWFGPVRTAWSWIHRFWSVDPWLQDHFEVKFWSDFFNRKGRKDLLVTPIIWTELVGIFDRNFFLWYLCPGPCPLNSDSNVLPLYTYRFSRVSITNNYNSWFMFLFNNLFLMGNRENRKTIDLADY